MLLTSVDTVFTSPHPMMAGYEWAKCGRAGAGGCFPVNAGSNPYEVAHLKLSTNCSAVPLVIGTDSLDQSWWSMNTGQVSGWVRRDCWNEHRSGECVGQEGLLE